jgi:hypothetical protein
VAEAGGRASLAQEQLEKAPLSAAAPRPSRRSRSQRELASATERLPSETIAVAEASPMDEYPLPFAAGRSSSVVFRLL